MAATKIIAIRSRLDKRVNYVVNPDKTMLDDRILYSVNPEKTQQLFYAEAINCISVETAFHEMQAVKEQYGKLGGVLGYHIIQSFAPGEVTPQQAHNIGMDFARQVFGDRFQAVIGTHLDKAHLHNHIIVNSVSFLDGGKYHSNVKSYYETIRAVSDDLCRRHHLSVITPAGNGKQYGQWRAEKENKPTLRSVVRADMDAALRESYTLDIFFNALRKRGYIVCRRSEHRKYTTVRPPGGQRSIRLISLGEDYAEEGLLRRLKLQRAGLLDTQPQQYHSPRRYRVKRKNAAHRQKITGFQALYLRYLYFLRSWRVQKPGRRPHSPQRILQIEQYDRQFRYLRAQNITTAEELEARMITVQGEISTAVEQRKTLYTERRTADEETQKILTQTIYAKTAALRALRKERSLLRRIQEEIPQIRKQMQTQQLKKEELTHEYQRRSR